MACTGMCNLMGRRKMRRLQSCALLPSFCNPTVVGARVLVRKMCRQIAMLLQSLKELTSTSKSPIGKSRSGRHRLATSSHDSYNWDNEGSHRTSNG
eukprot:143681-Pelagomonas_calceolata.AAC.7